MAETERRGDAAKEDDPRERFLRLLCDHRTQFQWIFIVCVTFALIQAPYLVVADPGTKLFVISVLNVSGLVFFGAVTGLVLWQCRKLRARQPI